MLLFIIMVNGIMLSVIMLSVVAPLKQAEIAFPAQKLYRYCQK